MQIIRLSYNFLLEFLLGFITKFQYVLLGFSGEQENPIKSNKKPINSVVYKPIKIIRVAINFYRHFNGNPINLKEFLWGALPRL